VVGIPLSYISLSGRYDLRPNIRVFGVPFLAAVWEFDGKHWIDFVGPLSPLALLGNGAVAVLLPQLLITAFMRRPAGR
jgi:hypothetical protein